MLLSVLSYFWTNHGNDAGTAWFIALSWLAVLTHGIGHIVLFRGILEMGPESRFQRMLSLFLASLLFCVVGFLTLPVFFPGDPNAWYFYPPWLGFFPHVPTVFGPVVMAHGTIFLLASKDFARHRSRVITVAGAAVFFVLGTSGIAIQVLVGVPPSFPSPLAPLSFLGSLTLLGYVLIAGGFQLEMTPRLTRSRSSVA